MKPLLQSSFVLLMLALLTTLSIVNTCQIDHLESTTIATRRAVEELVSRGAARSSASAPSSGWSVSTQERAALADPANLLEPNPRPLVAAKRVVRGGTLRTLVGHDPPGLNAYASPNATNISSLLRYVGNTLATRQKDNPDRWSPELAIKVTELREGLSYEITLRRGVYWHKPEVDWSSGRYAWLEGEHELTSDDFAFAIETIMNPQVTGRAASLRNYFDAFERCEVVDRYRFRVSFKQALFTNLSSVLELVPLPRWLYMHGQDGRRFEPPSWGLKLNEHWYNQKLIGTGPYRFVRWQPGASIVLQRNPDYWGEPPAFDKVVILIVKDQSAFARELKTGNVDYAILRSEQYQTAVTDNVGPILGSEHIKLARMPSLSYSFVGWNLDSPLFSDKRVRQAMTMALDREQIIKNVFHGLGTLHTGPYPKQSPCYDKQIRAWAFDLKAAAARLEQAGWKDRDGDGIRDKLLEGRTHPFEFTLVTFASSTEYQTMASIYREALLQIGVRMHPRPLEWSTLLKKLDEKEFGAYTGVWALPWEVDLMQLWHSTQADRPASSNRVGFRNPRADRIAEALRSEFDPPERQRLCRAFHALVHEEQPYTFVYQREDPVLYWDHMNDLEFSPIWPWSDLLYYSFNQRRP
ncbi:MAG: ABC transporter substrate-binding protein [Proteobacteria bacterium]|nr:ABC transporter substrate-binding protein [Pseudomonadota bacterium]